MSKKNLTLIYKSLVLALGVFIFIYSMVKYFMSKEVWDDGWGTDIAYNMDYVVDMIAGICITVIGALLVYGQLKSKNYAKECLTCATVVPFVYTFYNFGVFFKALTKAVSKGKEFDFASYEVNLFTAIAFLIVLAACVILYITKYLKKN